MIEHGKGILKRIGFTKEFLREEIYWVPGKRTDSGESVGQVTGFRGEVFGLGR